MLFKQKERECEAHVSDEIAESQQDAESASFDVRETLKFACTFVHFPLKCNIM